MAISVNGGANPTRILYNGNDLNKVVYNGTTVWEKVAAGTAYWNGSGDSIYGNGNAYVGVFYRVPFRYYINISDPSGLVGSTDISQGQANVYDHSTGTTDVVLMDSYTVTISGVNTSSSSQTVGEIKLSLYNADTNTLIGEYTITVWTQQP